jgi:hypothetical protein
MEAGVDVRESEKASSSSRKGEAKGYKEEGEDKKRGERAHESNSKVDLL